MVGVLSLIFASHSFAGVTYKTLRNNETLTVDPTDVIELVGSKVLRFDGKFNGGDDTFETALISQGAKITNLTEIRAYHYTGVNSESHLTVKITSKDDPAPTQANNVAVIPEDENGQYEVMLESSTDLITWTPANAGTYGGTTTKRFFRTRIVKKDTAAPE